MKKILTSTLALAALFAANAADFTVYNNGNLSAGINVYGWWNNSESFVADNPTGGDTKVFSFKAADGGAAASMGLYANGNEIVTGTLHTGTLNFKWYATTPATYTVRVTANQGKEENYTWTVTEETANKWQTLSLPVETIYPQVAAEWNDFVGKGEGYIFSIVLEGGSAESVIYFDNIYYSNIDQSWEKPFVPELVPPTTVPAIKHAKDEVLSVFSAYGTAPFIIGGWGQSTISTDETIDGSPVKKLEKFNYLGWEFNPALDVTGYTHVHVDFYPCEETAFGFTPISPGKEKSWIAASPTLNEWNSYDVKLTEFPCDWTNVFQMKFDQGKMVTCYLANVYFYKDENETPEPVVPGDGAVFNGTNSGVITQDNIGYPYSLEYSVRYNEDNTLTITADYIFSSGEPYGAIPGTVYINNEGFDMTQKDNVRSVTTSKTFEAGKSLQIRFYIPAGNGVVYQDEFTYIVGSKSPVTGVELVEAEGMAEYYTLQGVRVSNPERGLFIRVQNGKAEKIVR